MVGHVVPEAACGGPLAAVRDGDEIVLDVAAGRIDLALSAQELAARMAALPPPPGPPAGTGGALAKYAALVGSASEGAVTNPCLPAVAAETA
jgi:dihydroxy-acid dehydratase